MMRETRRLPEATSESLAGMRASVAGLLEHEALISPHVVSHLRGLHAELDSELLGRNGITDASADTR
jgi:hypothetical protein